MSALVPPTLALKGLPGQRIGIVIPAWNCMAWIKDTLRSLLAQTSSAWTAVVVDDGSTDGTGEAAREFVRKHLEDGRRAEGRPVITVLAQSHFGLVEAVNSGMSYLAMMADPPALVTCCAADDMLGESYVAELLAAAVQNPTAPCVYGIVNEFGTRQCFWSPGEWEAGKVLTSTTIPGCAVWRRGVWEQLGGFDYRFTAGLEDWHLAAKAELFGFVGPLARPLFVPTAVYFHRARADSLTDTMHPDYRAWAMQQIAGMFTVHMELR